MMQKTKPLNEAKRHGSAERVRQKKEIDQEHVHTLSTTIKLSKVQPCFSKQTKPDPRKHWEEIITDHKWIES